VFSAVRRVRAAGLNPDVWLYKGAWEEWEPHEIEMAVPLSPEVLERKKQALRLHATEGFAPALIVGLPVGFVGAAEAKARLRASVVPSISNVGDKGGSAVAAAAVNAMVRLATGG
jgi:hypothetical protein